MSKVTALVLSGGGMFGSYQAGVWSALHSVIQPDIIVGASIGSLNGWLIAGGYSGEALEQSWLNLGEGFQVSWRVPRNLAEGIIDPSLAEGWIRKIYESCSPRIRYALVATEMRTMKRVRFEWPGLSWQHLAASCAVPLFLRQQTIGGVMYGDGGLADPLPLFDAIEMGATRIVAVNVLKHRPMVVRAAAAAARLYGRHRKSTQEHVEIVDISPAAPLGTGKESVYWTRQNAERWIAMGKTHATKAKHLVVECFERSQSISTKGNL
ncbi:MAG: patatin-like phospholipase family protein [Bryobacteraceae bacterium]